MRAITVLLLFISLRLASQGSFEKYGPMGAQVYTDLKTALKVEKGVYKMDLSYQQLEPKLFNKIGKLKDLQALHLTSNSVNTWPEDIGKLSSLVYLASINNEFNSFPKDLKYLSSLMYLELFGTKIDSIPYDIAFLQRLKVLKLSGGEDTLRMTTKMRFIKTLTELTLEHYILDSCPRPLFRIPGLKFLAITNCAVQAIPEVLDKSTNLEVLILDFNKLNKLPRGIYKCKKLIYLSLKNNKLTKIPDTICHLTNLTQLDLRGNPLSKDDVEEVRALLTGCKVLF